jgi:hypothetical protein
MCGGGTASHGIYTATEDTVAPNSRRHRSMPWVSPPDLSNCHHTLGSGDKDSDMDLPTGTRTMSAPPPATAMTHRKGGAHGKHQENADVQRS